MSRVTPPAPNNPAGSGGNNPQRPNPSVRPNPQAAAPGMPATKPNVTPAKAPTVGASAPPTAGGVPANKVPPHVPTRPAAAAPPKPATPGAPGAAKTNLPAGGTTTTPAPGTSGGGQTAMPPVDQLQGRPIGRVLTKMGKVTREQVVEALTFQKSKGGALGRILIDLGYIKESDLNIALAAQQGYEMVSLEGRNITPQMVEAVPAQLATTQKVLPIEFDKATKKLTVAMASHENFRAIDDLRALMGYDVQAVLAEPSELERLINKHYQSAAQGIGDILSELNSDDSLKDMKNRGESI